MSVPGSEPTESTPQNSRARRWKLTDWRVWFGLGVTGIALYWTFHDMQADSYGWYAHTSRDRGLHFEKTWIIAGTRSAPLKQ